MNCLVEVMLIEKAELRGESSFLQHTSFMLPSVVDTINYCHVDYNQSAIDDLRSSTILVHLLRD